MAPALSPDERTAAAALELFNAIENSEEDPLHRDVVRAVMEDNKYTGDNGSDSASVTATAAAVVVAAAAAAASGNSPVATAAAALTPQYLVGLQVQKEFPGFGWYLGTVVSYDDTTKCYKVQYIDGDAEELTESELGKIVVGVKKGKYSIGLQVQKEFPNLGMFLGTIAAYDPATGYYKIQYTDGDMEELTEEELEGILLAAKKRTMTVSSPQQQKKRKRKKIRKTPKYPLGKTTVSKYFEGYGWYAGTVVSYDNQMGYYRIEYHDGDAEEADEEDVSAILDLREQGDSTTWDPVQTYTL